MSDLQNLIAHGRDAEGDLLRMGFVYTIRSPGIENHRVLQYMGFNNWRQHPYKGRDIQFKLSVHAQAVLMYDPSIRLQPEKPPLSELAELHKNIEKARKEYRNYAYSKEDKPDGWIVEGPYQRPKVCFTRPDNLNARPFKFLDKD